MNNIGEIIKKRRKELGLTQVQLAEKMGVRGATITRYETGEIKNIRRDKIARLAEALQIDPMVLINENIDEMTFNASKIQSGVKTALDDVKGVLVDGHIWKPIPIYGVIKAGIPSLANNELLGYEYFDVENTSEYFALLVSGDSMIGARIYDGDSVLVKRQSEAADGEVVAVLIDGQDSTLKRVRYSMSAVTFHAENSAYEPIVVPYTKLIEDPDYIRILGVVKKFLGDVK